MEGNKPYFAEWIPVGGETKVGEKIFYNGAVRTMQPDAPLKIQMEGATTKHEYYKLRNAVPAKPFLCSRDIQVGDKYTQEGVDRLYPEARFICIDHSPEGDPIDDEGKCHAKAYKIMGEISPDATWVKEGDEFERNDFEMRWVNTKGQHSLAMRDVDTEEDSPILKAFIKGPCGHFH